MAKRPAKSRQTTTNISMPVSLRRYVDARVSRDGFGNVSEYFRYLVRAERSLRAPSWLEEMVEEGLGGPFEVTDDAWWAERVARLESAIEARGRGRRRSA